VVAIATLLSTEAQGTTLVDESSYSMLDLTSQEDLFEARILHVQDTNIQVLAYELKDKPSVSSSSSVPFRSPCLADDLRNFSTLRSRIAAILSKLLSALQARSGDGEASSAPVRRRSASFLPMLVPKPASYASSSNALHGLDNNNNNNNNNNNSGIPARRRSISFLPSMMLAPKTSLLHDGLHAPVLQQKSITSVVVLQGQSGMGLADAAVFVRSVCVKMDLTCISVRCRIEDKALVLGAFRKIFTFLMRTVPLAEQNELLRDIQVHQSSAGMDVDKLRRLQV
jgi:hypothetical protein